MKFFLTILMLALPSKTMAVESIESKEGLDEVAKRALNGTSADSYRLARHYSSHENYRFLDYFFYLRLSVEQGSCEGIKEMQKLQDFGVKDDFAMKEDWSNRAKEAGCKSPAAASIIRPQSPPTD